MIDSHNDCLISGNHRPIDNFELKDISNSSLWI